MTDQPDDLQRLKQLLQDMRSEKPDLRSQMQALELMKLFFKMTDAQRKIVLDCARRVSGD